jgi:3-dehydro-L-gulonate 2-dehydrogenase
MRGGTYGWQAADQGYISICMTNTIANMPPWGGKDPRLGNNPLVISIPRSEGNIVLDMAMSQYSYGKLQEYELDKRELPFPGGYNEKGELTIEPVAIRKSKRVLPVGFWKGSGLSLMIDMLVTVLSGGRSTPQVTSSGQEYGLSQFFLCIDPGHLDDEKIKEIIDYTKSSTLSENSGSIFYPGENTLKTRNENLLNGIPVNEEIWQKVLSM